jgi:hypothetical protein
MIEYPSAWVFNLALRLAILVCLGTLIVGLVVGVGPLTALMRSGIAFLAFVVLGWVSSVLFDVAPPEEVEEDEDNAENEENEERDSNEEIQQDWVNEMDTAEGSPEEDAAFTSDEIADVARALLER